MIIRKQPEVNLVQANPYTDLHELTAKRFDGDKYEFNHAQCVDPILQFAHEMREHSNNGFTDDKSMRMIGFIPELEFRNHPEWMKDPNEILKWLKTPAGAPYRTVKKGI